MSIKVDFIASLSEPFGMCQHARSILAMLDKVSDVATFGFDPSKITNRISQDEILLLMNTANKPARVPDVTIQFVLPPSYQPRPDAYNIGILSWETSKLPNRTIDFGNGLNPALNDWVSQCKKMDEIWTFSMASAEALKKAGVSSVHIIPGPIDVDLWNPDAPIIKSGVAGIQYDSNGNIVKDKFRIGYIADWNERKDIETFISCTSIALPAVNSTIILKSHDYISGLNLKDAVKLLKNRLIIQPLPEIVLIDQDLSPSDMVGLMQTFDAYACTSKGEGLNLPLLQAMALGKTVVAPNHTAHSDYIKHGENGWLISAYPELVRTMVRNPWYQNDQIWGKINEIEYIQTLQNIHRQWAAGKSLFNAAARQTVVERYSKSKCEEFLNKRFERFLRS